MSVRKKKSPDRRTEAINRGRHFEGRDEDGKSWTDQSLLKGTDSATLQKKSGMKYRERGGKGFTLKPLQTEMASYSFGGEEERLRHKICKSE